MKLTEEGRLWANETVRKMEDLMKERLSEFSPADNGLNVRLTIESEEWW